mgnify:CR=1 FL=1
MNSTTEVTTANLSDPSVADEVFATIAALCGCRIPGVVGLSGLPVERAEDMLGRGETIRGVKIASTVEDVSVDITVDVSDQIPIPQIASSLQQEIKERIEQMTDHKVTSVNVTVEGIRVQSDSDQMIENHAALSQPVGA